MPHGIAKCGTSVCSHKKFLSRVAVAFAAIALSRLIHGWLVGPLPLVLALAVGVVVVIADVAEAQRLRNVARAGRRLQSSYIDTGIPATLPRQWVGVPGDAVGTLLGVLAFIPPS